MEFLSSEAKGIALDILEDILSAIEKNRYFCILYDNIY